MNNNRFVTPEPAGRQAAPIRAYPVQNSLELPQLHTNQVTVTGTHVDRAAAFNLRVACLSLTVGAGSALVGVVGVGVPLFSLAALAWLVGGYMLTWLVAYLADAAISPEGAALFGAWRAWRWLDREQEHRHYLELRQNFPGDYE